MLLRVALGEKTSTEEESENDANEDCEAYLKAMLFMSGVFW